jgi:Uma2 family endonuclease
MRAASRYTTGGGNGAVPRLENGDRLTQAEFHRRYEAMPPHVKAELIGGIVYMASAVRRPHGHYHPELSGVLWVYAASTAGTEVLDNTTTVLDEQSEPQPDLALRILSDYGGQSQETEDQYIEGAPEWLGEIAHSTEAMDLHRKRDDYQHAGVLEYLVVCIAEQQLHWFDFQRGREIRPDRKGIFKSRVFPGLWIDGPALLQRNSKRLIEVVQQGLDSPAHAAFVKRLERQRRQRS